MSGRKKEFPWTVDQYQRYAVLREFLKEFYAFLAAKPYEGVNRYENIKRKVDEKENKERSKSAFMKKNIQIKATIGQDKIDEIREVVEARGFEGKKPGEETPEIKAGEEETPEAGTKLEKRQKVKVLDVGGLSPTKDGLSYWLPLDVLIEEVKEEVLVEEGVVTDIIFPPFRKKQFIQADGLELPFCDNSFEVVSALDVIEHVEKEKREAFVGEICRVCSGSVLISAPVASTEIEAADKTLFETIKRLFQVEHCQLLEHLEKGLPERKLITEWLQKKMPGGTEFSYGSLSRWLFFQTIRALFLDYYRREEVFDLIDRLVLSLDPKGEMRPPFSRHFWVYSRSIPVSRLETGVKLIQERLAKEHFEFSFDEAINLNHLVVDFWTSKGISALVVSRGREAILGRCLRHLLSQKIDQSLDVSVWIIEGEIPSSLRQEFPGVKFIGERKRDLRLNDLRRRIMKLKGEWILLLDESILLPETAVASLWQEAMKFKEEIGAKIGERAPKKMTNNQAFSKLAKNRSVKIEAALNSKAGEKKQDVQPVFCPRLVQGKRSYGVWAGRRPSLWKFLAGRQNNVFWKFSSQGSHWLYGECLFFPREALFLRRGREGRIKKRNIFLWEAEDDGLRFNYCPQIVVYKRV